MGWVNYVIIKKWKIMFEISRHVSDLDEDAEEEIKKLWNESESYYNKIDKVRNKKISDIRVCDIQVLSSFSESYVKISTIDSDNFLLYWLKSKEIDYEILSEHDERIKEYENYKKLGKW